MTAPDLERVLGEVSALARRAGDLALRSPDFPAHEAASIMEALTGVRLDRVRACELGPERAGAVHFAKAVEVLSSMLAAQQGLNIGMAGVLDDLQAPARAGRGEGYDPARRVCLRCGRAFASDWRGHRICRDCAPAAGGRFARRRERPVHGPCGAPARPMNAPCTAAKVDWQKPIAVLSRTAGH